MREIRNIWFEFSVWQEAFDPHDCNSDVIFELTDGSKWTATFFTYKNIETLRRKNERTGECLHGAYFCAANMILVAEMSEEVILAVLTEMLCQNKIEIYCEAIGENGAL